MRNILIACLSAYPQRVQSCEYSRKIGKVFPEIRKAADTGLIRIQDGEMMFEGVSTNEPAMKVVIAELANRKNSSRLDEIIILRTDKVREERFSPKEGCPEAFREAVEGKTISEYYQSTVRSFSAGAFADLYGDHEIRFESFDISDEPTDRDIAEISVRIAEHIRESGEEAVIHIDYNGGMRFIASMFLSVANLIRLSSRNRIGKVISCNYRQGAGIQTIAKYDEIFSMPQLISNLSECVRYGRVEGLQEQFQGLGATEKNILAKIRLFIENLQICGTDMILKCKDDVAGAIEAYLNSEEAPEQSQNRTKLTMFRFVLREMNDTYYDLLHLELPDMIEWCVGHGFIQQALTFGSENSPSYMLRSGMVRITGTGREDFRNAKKEDRKSGRQARYFSSSDPNEMRYPFEWFVCLQNNESVVPKGGQKGKTLVCAREKGFLESPLGDEELETLYGQYLVIKDLRNSTNHANGRYTYADVKGRLEEYVGLLKEMTPDADGEGGEGPAEAPEDG